MKRELTLRAFVWNLRALRGEAEALEEDGPRNDAEWSALMKIADDHGVLPTLWLALRDEIDTLPIPDFVRDALGCVHELNALRNEAIVGQYLTIESKFREAGIRCLPLKGTAYLFHRLHGDIGGRLQGDLDVITPRNAVAEAAALMTEMGYRQTDGDDPPDEFPHHLSPLCHDDAERAPAVVDLHHAVAPHETDVPFSSAALFRDAVTVHPPPLGALAGEQPDEILVPSLRHAFDHALIHGARSDHHYARRIVILRDALDLHRLARRLTESGHAPDTAPAMRNAKARAHYRVASRLFEPGLDEWLTAPGKRSLHESIVLFRIGRYQNKGLEFAVLENLRRMRRRPGASMGKLFSGKPYRSLFRLMRRP